MRKSFTKLIFRQITYNYHRFFSILLIVALGVSFYSGLRATSPNMKMTAENYLNEQNVMDIEIFSPTGLTDDDVNNLKTIDDINEVMPSYTSNSVLYLNDTNYMMKVESYSTDDSINQPKLIQGSYPKNSTECLIDNKIMELSHLSLGDEVTLQQSTVPLNIETFKIVGIVNSPKYISIERGYSTSGEITGFVLVSPEAFQLPVYTNVYLTIEKENMSRFESQYENKMNDVKNELLSISVDKQWYITDFTENTGFSSYQDDTERIAAVAQVFPVIFFLVSSLVTLTSMTRMVENDRSEIGTIKSLGYHRFDIVRKYLLYALLASVVGGIVGFIIGVQLFPNIIFDAYGILYVLKPLEVIYHPPIAILSILTAIGAVVIPAYLACVHSFHASPAMLMRPKAPQPGKRIFLERISFIWKRLKFIQKVTARNLFRYKKRFIMTIIGISGCTALLLTGFGLRDSIGSIIDRQFSEIRHYDAEIHLNEEMTLSEEQRLHPNIDDTFYIHQETMKINDNEEVYLIVPSEKKKFNEFMTLRTRKEHKEIQLDDHSVILTEKVASLLNVNVGSTITLGSNEVKVSGIVENYVYHYVFMTPVLYQSLYNQSPSYNVVLTKLISTSEEQEKRLTKDLIEDDSVQTIRFISQIKGHFVNMINTLNDVVYILIVSAALLAFLVLFTLSNINIDERKRELATIKVLGFYDKEVSSYIDRENYILTSLGIVFGLVLGYYLHRYVIVTTETDIVMFSRKIFTQSFLYSVLLTFIFALIVNLSMHFRIRRIDMIDSLKNVE